MFFPRTLRVAIDDPVTADYLTGLQDAREPVGLRVEICAGGLTVDEAPRAQIGAYVDFEIEDRAEVKGPRGKGRWVFDLRAFGEDVYDLVFNRPADGEPDHKVYKIPKTKGEPGRLVGADRGNGPAYFKGNEPDVYDEAEAAFAGMPWRPVNEIVDVSVALETTDPKLEGYGEPVVDTNLAAFRKAYADLERIRAEALEADRAYQSSRSSFGYQLNPHDHAALKRAQRLRIDSIKAEREFNDKYGGACTRCGGPITKAGHLEIDGEPICMDCTPEALDEIDPDEDRPIGLVPEPLVESVPVDKLVKPEPPERKPGETHDAYIARCKDFVGALVDGLDEATRAEVDALAGGGKRCDDLIDGMTNAVEAAFAEVDPPDGPLDKLFTGDLDGRKADAAKIEADNAALALGGESDPLGPILGPIAEQALDAWREGCDCEELAHCVICEPDKTIERCIASLKREGLSDRVRRATADVLIGAVFVDALYDWQTEITDPEGDLENAFKLAAYRYLGGVELPEDRAAQDAIALLMATADHIDRAADERR